jgi:hypothetical protein
MNRLENKVIIPGLKQGIFDNSPDKIVPLRAGRLDNTPFGNFVGKTFKCGMLLAINYYGHYKLSSGILSAIESIEDTFPDVRCIKASVVHFNSIKIEHIEKLADKEMIADFAEFKKQLVSLRWDNKK